MRVYVTIIGIVLIAFICSFISRIVKRISAYSKLDSLVSMCGADIKHTRLPLLSFFKLSSKPDTVIRIGQNIYLIRFINGISKTRYLHFANENFFVTFSKHVFFPKFRAAGRRANKNSVYSSTSFRKVKILPDISLPEKYREYSEKRNCKVIPVLIFSPAPNEVTFVSETKTSIKLAFTGDEFYGMKIFTPKTFVTYADRVKRQSDSDLQIDLFI